MDNLINKSKLFRSRKQPVYSEDENISNLELSEGPETNEDVLSPDIVTDIINYNYVHGYQMDSSNKSSPNSSNPDTHAHIHAQLPIPPIDIGYTVGIHHSDTYNKQILESLQQLVHPAVPRDNDSPGPGEYDAYSTEQSNLNLLFKELELQVSGIEM